MQAKTTNGKLYINQDKR